METPSPAQDIVQPREASSGTCPTGDRCSVSLTRTNPISAQRKSELRTEYPVPLDDSSVTVGDLGGVDSDSCIDHSRGTDTR